MVIQDFNDNPYIQRIRPILRMVFNNNLGRIGFAIIVITIAMAALAPVLAPYPPLESQEGPDGNLLQTQPPTQQHPLGTTQRGYDVLSQVIYGAQTSVYVGLLSALALAVIGSSIGIVSGYYGGKVDEVLMRFTDVAFGIPFLPFVIVLVGLLGQSTLNVIIGISALLWRTSARVIRAQVISVSEQQFIKELESMGASDFRIMSKHIMPNVLPLIVLYSTLGLGWAIILEASLSFIGLGAPLGVSWGQMLNNAFSTGLIRNAWWWTFPPGIMISALILGTFMFGRAFEAVINPELRNP